MENNKNPHKGHRQRMKDKARISGIEAWPYHEVLELLLMYTIPQKDVNPLAHTLIDQFGSLAGVLDADWEQLEKIKGLGKEASLFLSLLPDVFNKYKSSKNSKSIKLDTTYGCVQYFKSIDEIKNYEVFYVFCLNAKKELIKTFKFRGELASSVEFSRRDFAEKITFPKNKSIVIMHTHPGGSSQPTKTDFAATNKLFDICLTLGVWLEDHIIVAEDNFYSFLHDSGMYPDFIARAKNIGTEHMLTNIDKRLPLR